MDYIHIEELELDCIVGVRPWERRRPQRILLDLSLGLDASRAGRLGRIGLTCDSDQVAAEVQALLRFREYQLIEVATEELAAMLFGVHGALRSVEIKLTKRGALPGRARGAAVSLQRVRSEYPRRSVTAPFGQLEVLLETYEAGLYLLSLEPGGSLKFGPTAGVREHGWVVSGELARGSKCLGAGDSLSLGLGSAGVFSNRGSGKTTVFLCRCPPHPSE
jgi:dihydroneopterin aldolase